MDDIYVVTAHYDNGEPYEYNYARDDLLGAYESKDFAKHAIDNYIKCGDAQRDYFDGEEIREVVTDTEDSHNWYPSYPGRYRIFELNGIDHENDDDPFVIFCITKIGVNSPFLNRKF